jgi:hypothetical protein
MAISRKLGYCCNAPSETDGGQYPLDEAEGNHIESSEKILREVALTYRWARRAGKGQNEAVDAAIEEYCQLSPYATGDKLAVLQRGQPDDRGGNECHPHRSGTATGASYVSVVGPYRPRQ